MRECCTHCEEMIEKGSSALPVCQLEIGQASAEVMWEEVNELLEGDPARCIALSVLAVLQLFPNPYSPMGFHRTVAQRILSEVLGNSDQNSGPYSISALRGFHNFVVSKRYEFEWEKSVDLEELDAYGQYVYVWDQCGTESEMEMDAEVGSGRPSMDGVIEEPSSSPSVTAAAPAAVNGKKTVCITRPDEGSIIW